MQELLHQEWHKLEAAPHHCCPSANMFCSAAARPNCILPWLFQPALMLRLIQCLPFRQVATLLPYLTLFQITTMCGYVTVSYRYKCHHVVEHPRQFAPCENARTTGRNCRMLNRHQNLGSISLRGKCPTCRAAEQFEIRRNTNKKNKKKKGCNLL